MSKNIIVAVDGPAGSGKSSVSKQAALHCGLQYIDSGAIYRSITMIVMQNCDRPQYGMDLMHFVTGSIIRQEFLPTGVCKTLVNDRDVSREIRDEQITAHIGIISDDLRVREYVNNLLRSWAFSSSVIMDGRDIGSVVFPHADIKVFIDASVEVRAARRVKEYNEMGKNVDENSIRKQIIQRDEQDYSRLVGKLVRAEDAFYVDTTQMSRNEVISQVEHLINSLKQ